MTARIHVGIDATSWENNRGFGRFTRALVTTLAQRSNGFRYTLLFDRVPDHGLPPGVDVISAATKETLNNSAVGDTSRSFGYLWTVGSLARRARFDVFFFPSVYSYFPILARVPCVVCYHDATAERFPHLVFPTALNRRLWQLKTAMARFQTTRAMTISQSSAEDVERIIGIPRDRIDLVTEGADPTFRVINDPGVKMAARARCEVPANAEMLVYVGGINPHKNLIGLLKAMPQVMDSRPDVHLVIIGDTSGKGFWGNVTEVRAYAASHPLLKERVHFAGYVADPQLAEILNSADAFVFPSLWEGFGLPAVEAMSCGLPVLASRRSSLPEIVGKAGLFFDPENPAEIASCIVSFLGNSQVRADLRNLALAQARQFTWQRGAELAEICFRRCRGFS